MVFLPAHRAGRTRQYHFHGDELLDWLRSLPHDADRSSP